VKGKTERKKRKGEEGGKKKSAQVFFFLWHVPAIVWREAQHKKKEGKIKGWVNPPASAGESKS